MSYLHSSRLHHLVLISRVCLNLRSNEVNVTVMQSPILLCQNGAGRWYAWFSYRPTCMVPQHKIPCPFKTCHSAFCSNSPHGTGGLTQTGNLLKFSPYRKFTVVNLKTCCRIVFSKSHPGGPGKMARLRGG